VLLLSKALPYMALHVASGPWTQPAICPRGGQCGPRGQLGTRSPRACVSDRGRTAQSVKHSEHMAGQTGFGFTGGTAKAVAPTTYFSPGFANVRPGALPVPPLPWPPPSWASEH
jgi:hypothetical protein